MVQISFEQLGQRLLQCPSLWRGGCDLAETSEFGEAVKQVSEGLGCLVSNSDLPTFLQAQRQAWSRRYRMVGTGSQAPAWRPAGHKKLSKTNL